MSALSLDFLLPPTLDVKDIELRRRARLIVYAVVIAVAATSLVAGALALTENAVTGMRVAALLLPQLIILLILRQTGSVRLAAYLFMLVITGAVVIQFGSESGYGVMATIVLPLAAAHLIDARAGVLWTLFGVAWAAFLGPLVFKAESYQYVLSLCSAILTLAVGIASIIVESTRARAVREAETAQGALEDERHRVREVVRKIFPGLVDIDGIEEGRITYAAPGLVSLVGYSPEEVVGRCMPEFMHPEDFRLVMRQLQDQHFVSAVEARLRHREGHWVWTNLYAVPGPIIGEQQSWTLAGYDVGQEREDRERLIQAQRLEGIGILAAGIAHDFNNLLMVISGFADLLEDGEARRNILQSTDDASVLVQKLMAFGPNASLEEENADVVELVTGLTKVLHSVLGPGVALDVDVCATPQWVGLSSSQLNQIILNLVANAKAAIAGEGRVRIEVAERHLEEGTLDLPAGRYVELVVTDSGVGMDDHTLRHAFDPFFTTKADKSGTGLGLSSVYGIVHNCGGHVRLASEPGVGTTAVARLPFTAPLVQVSPVALPDVIDLDDAEILVVEDDLLIADLIRKTLTKSGYRVTVRYSVGEALRALQGVPPDLLITDIMMPDGRGTELAGRLRENWAGLPILFISGYSDQQIGEWREAAGDVRFLAKPFRAHELMTRVQQLLPVAAS